MKILVLAPHLLFPIRNGADKYISDKWSSVYRTHKVTLLSMTGIHAPTSDGHWNELSRHATPSLIWLNALTLPLRFLLGKRQYLAYKYCNNRIIDAAKSAIEGDHWDAIIVSFIPVHEGLYNLLKDRKRVIIETHNFDQKIYHDRAKETRGIRSFIYKIAAKRSSNYLAKIKHNASFIALGKSDFALYKNIGIHSLALGELGFKHSNERTIFPESGQPKTLVFVGSLNIQMNVFAVTSFLETHWDRLRALDQAISLKIIGSNPSRAFVEQCEEYNGVSVFPNLSDLDLKHEVCRSHAAVLPFLEVNGQKLKLSLVLENGIPVISFSNLIDELERAGVIKVTKSPSEMIDFLKQIENTHTQQTLAVSAQKYCSSRSWDQTANTSLSLISNVT